MSQTISMRPVTVCALPVAARLPARPASLRRGAAPCARRQALKVRAFRESEDTVAVPLDVCQALGVSRAASRASCIAAFDSAVHSPPKVGYSQVRGHRAALNIARHLRSEGDAFESSICA